MSALAIMTNRGSLRTQANLSATTRALNQAIGRLSSGLRISSAADDAAGMAVTENMRGQLRGYQQAMRNSNDGISILQTAESAYQSISDTLIRMRELSIQAANDSLSDTERGFIDTEFQDLAEEITRISDVTEFNGIKLLNGGAGTAGTMTFQVGTRNTADDRITVALDDQDAASLGLATSAVSTRAGAQVAIDELDQALESLNTDRAAIGSSINTLNAAVNNLSSTIENYSASMGQIRDADIGEESATFARYQVLQQAGVAMLSQANALPNLALRLLG